MKIVSDKSLRVTTLGGTAVLFEAGVPREIAEEIGLLAIQMGAKEYGTSTVEETVKKVAEFEEVAEEVAEEASADVVEALQYLIEEANPNSFKNDGTPKAAVLNEMIGRTIRAEERESAWEIALNS
jgi:hypothetical protein